MDILAIISQLLPLVLSVVAVSFCVTLFRDGRQFAWLLVAVVFLEPFVPIILRALRGKALLQYTTTETLPDPDPAIKTVIHYKFLFPILFIVSVVGLYLLVRERRGTRPQNDARESDHPKVS